MPAGGSDFAPGQELARERGGAVESGERPRRAHTSSASASSRRASPTSSSAPPGADGPVVDHWNVAAVRRYLDHMSSGLAPALGGRLGEKLGGPLRASFVDSLELDHANWTDDLPAEFARRRGYDLAPYLPFVLEKDEPSD